jgi:hypothetical protein
MAEVQTPGRTVRQWLQIMVEDNTCSEADEAMMTRLLHRVGFPAAVVTCGIVYLEGVGQPMSIHTTAATLLKAGA